MNTSRIRRALVCVLSSLAACALPAAAQQYPTHTVHMIVSFAAGGPSDLVGRVVAQKLGESLGQPVVVENKPGAGANIGIGFVARAPADGYTILVASSAFTVNPSLYAKVPYDPFKDFVPVTCVGSSPNLIVVHPSLPAKNVKELIALVRAQPKQFNYGSPGTGTTPHLSGEMFRLALGLDMTHIPFNGAAPEVQALLSGQLPIGFASLPSFAPMVKAGKLRAIAVTANARAASLPDVPSTEEEGLHGMEADTFQGIFVPAGTPHAIVQRLHAEIVKGIAQPDARERLAAVGLNPIGNSQEEFAAQIRADVAKWGRIIRTLDIKAE
jgi:tripartite-type tricarboxylate transporter receptor subunit TctC